jgi:hypothetical protein
VVRRAAVAATLGVVALLVAGPASARAGPGVTLRQGSQPPRLVSGGQIGRGVSIRGLLQLAGFNPGAVRFVQVVGDGGKVLTVLTTELDSALVSDDGANTTFTRQARSGQGAADTVVSAPSTPIEMTVDGGSLLSVRASGSPTAVKVGQSITFTSSVRFAPPGAQLSYVWDFGDGTSGAGAQVTHRYTVSGDLQAQIKVQGANGTTAQCATVCGGVASVDVQVQGRERRPEQPRGLPQGSGNSPSLGGTGTGTGTGSGTGSGSASGTGGGSGNAPRRPRKKPPALRAQRPEPHSPFSSNPASGAGRTIVQGVLLAGAGAPIAGGLPPGKAAGGQQPARGVTGTVQSSSQIGGSLALALAIVSLGALRERRSVRLRVA